MKTGIKLMVVIGGGRIGIRIVAMSAPFGANVIILEEYTLLPDWDEDVRKFIKQHRNRWSVTLIEGADVQEYGLPRVSQSGMNAVDR
jgi:pyruvate/2-oxoglutarate dehydrogenase complex dihydrolipoamide dehydrogenase (E3) component